MDRQCPSCGGFCKKSGCERENTKPKRENAKPKEWVGLNSFDRTLLRTTYAPLKTLHHIKETDTTIVAEVVNDWKAFFTAIEEVLKEKNT